MPSYQTNVLEIADNGDVTDIFSLRSEIKPNTLRIAEVVAWTPEPPLKARKRRKDRGQTRGPIPAALVANPQ